MNKYKVARFDDDRLENNVVVESGFPLRNGGANKIMCFMICDEDGAVAFVTTHTEAQKIADLLNDAEYLK